MATRRPRLQVKPNVGGRSSLSSRSSNNKTTLQSDAEPPGHQNSDSVVQNSVKSGGSDSINEAADVCSVSALQEQGNNNEIAEPVSTGDLSANSAASESNSDNNTAAKPALRSRFTRARPNIRCLRTNKSSPAADSERDSVSNNSADKDSGESEQISKTDKPAIPDSHSTDKTFIEGSEDNITGESESQHSQHNRDNDKLCDSSSNVQAEDTASEQSQPLPRSRYRKFKPNVSKASSNSDKPETCSQQMPRLLRARPIIKRSNQVNANAGASNLEASVAKHVSFASSVQNKTCESDDEVPPVTQQNQNETDVRLSLAEQGPSTTISTEHESHTSADETVNGSDTLSVSNNVSDDISVERQSPSPSKQLRSPIIRRFSKPKPNVRDTRRPSSNASNVNLPDKQAEAETANVQVQQPTSQVLCESEASSQPVASTENQVTSPRTHALVEGLNKLIDKRQLARINETKELMAQKRKQFTRSKDTPDRSKMTMMDLIYWNPPNNPIKNSDRVKQSTEIIVTSDMDESCDNTDVKEGGNKEGDGNLLLVPQVTVNENGEIILDEESLVVNRPKKEIKSTVYETTSNVSYRSFRQASARAKRWTQKETARFYKALSIIGTDFTLISQLFKNRSRSELKKKFKYEERVHRSLVDNVINHSLHFDICQLDDDSLSEDEENVDDPQGKSADKNEKGRKRRKSVEKSTSEKTPVSKKPRKNYGKEVVDLETEETMSLKELPPPLTNRPKRNKRKKAYNPDEYEDESVIDSDASVEPMNDEDEEEEEHHEGQHLTTCSREQSVQTDSSAPQQHKRTEAAASSQKQSVTYAILPSAKPVNVIPDATGALADILQLPHAGAVQNACRVASISEPSPSGENVIRGQLVFMRSESPGSDAKIHVYLISQSPPHQPSSSPMLPSSPSTTSSLSSPFISTPQSANGDVPLVEATNL